MDSELDKIKEEVSDLIAYLEKAYYQLGDMQDEHLKDTFLTDLMMSAGSLGDCIHKLKKLLSILG